MKDDVIKPARETLGHRAISHCMALRRISEAEDNYTRLAFTSEHRQASVLISRWMTDAGLKVRTDAGGNVIGRLEGAHEHAPALVLGSHQDTVRDAGSYDGMLGITSAIMAVGHFAERRTPLPFALEVYAFTDEEGTRFRTTYLGSEMVAGTYRETTLAMTDRNGLTLAEAMTAYGLDPSRIEEASRDPRELLGYLELHIEQGPVLQNEGLSVASVTGISGQTRMTCSFTGTAGHAGTVPMGMRRDALAAAAEAIHGIENLFRYSNGIVGTVGMLDVFPGAANVIPGHCSFSIDIRSLSDTLREDAVQTVKSMIRHIAVHRELEHAFEVTNDTNAVECDAEMVSIATEACAEVSGRGFTMPSGAGHDACAIAEICPTAMVFVRCKDGISHNPAEHVEPEDARDGIAALIASIDALGIRWAKKARDRAELLTP